MTDQELIGRCIASVRKQRGLKQVDLGAAIGVSDQTISNWEVGLRAPRADYIRRMCRVLDCSADLLLGLERELDDTSRRFDGVFEIGGADQLAPRDADDLSL